MRVLKIKTSGFSNEKQIDCFLSGFIFKIFFYIFLNLKASFFCDKYLNQIDRFFYIFRIVECFQAAFCLFL